MFRTIRQRIAIPYVLLILLTMLSMGVYFSFFISRIYRTNLESLLVSQARLISDNLEKMSPENTDPEQLDQLARQWAVDAGARVTIIAADGTVLGESHEDSSAMENHLDRPEVALALNDGYGSSTRFSRSTGYMTVYVAVPVIENGKTAGVVRVSRPLEQAQTDLANLRRAMLAAALIVTVVAIVLALVIANATTRPIRQLTNAALELAQGKLEKRLVPTSEDEVGQLTQAFNLMASRIQGQITDLDNERSKLSTILKEMSDGVAIIDSQGRITMVNTVAESMFDSDQAVLIGLSLAEGFRNHQIVELWQHCRESQQAQSVIMEISTNRLYIQAIATPLGESMPGSTLLVFQNLTRQRYLETVRRDFISNLSHELRTPLASLKALTETLQEGAMDDPAAARRFLDRMEGEVDALTQVVSELLELSRIESGRVPMRLLQTRPIDIITPAADRLRVQADRADLSITLICANDLPEILADAARIEQVIVNLLHNAIKFTPAGGEIIISAHASDLSSLPEAIGRDLPPAEIVLFSVQDNGVGIPRDDLPRIFERFFKSDRARSSGGTGLGLAIARHTIEAHGGRIWVDSIEGKGSTFYFYIPVFRAFEPDTAM